MTVLKEIELKQFPTHVQLSKLKYFKISTQAIYNAKLNPFSRNKVMGELKKFILSELPKNYNLTKAEDFPIKLYLEIHAPINWGTVRRSKGEVKWKEAAIDYHPVHDLDNLAWIWGKVIQDCLVKKKIIPEDTVEFINRLEYKFVTVDTFDERKIKVTLMK